MATIDLRGDLLKQLGALLEGGQAHAGFEEAVRELPMHLQGVVPAGLPYSSWQIVEHLRNAQRDILDFSDNAGGTYRPLDWPRQYWPADAAPPDERAWETCVQAIRDDRATFLKLLLEGDLVTPFAWGDGQNLLREALLISDHNAYHVGELVVIRRLLGAGPPQ